MFFTSSSDVTLSQVDFVHAAQSATEPMYAAAIPCRDVWPSPKDTVAIRTNTGDVVELISDLSMQV